MASHTSVEVQPSIVPMRTYNHPCGDLLHGERRREYLEFVVPLYRASIAGDLEAAKVILEGREYLVRYSINENKETPLHVATAGGSHKLVRYLVDKMSKVELELQNRDDNTAFCIAAISGNVGVIKIMLNKNPALPNICGSKNMMPLYLAAFHGNHDMVSFLYDQLMLDRTIHDFWTDDDFMDEVLMKCVQANIFDVALRILNDNTKLPQEKHVWDMLQLLARKPQVFRTQPLLSYLISTNLMTSLKMSLRRFSEKTNTTLLLRLLLSKYPKIYDAAATRLLRLLWKRIIERLPKDIIDEILKGPMTIVVKKGEHEIEAYPSQILFIAAKMNNTRFLVELIREYPDLVSKTNDDGQTIFHISVYHRHHDTYRLLYETGSLRDLITCMTDHEGNNILHLVGKKLEENVVFKDRVITPFHMCGEFLWYKEVECILPPPYRDAKNTAGETPKEVFTKNYEKLVSVGMKSMNETINISMVVAALVCTIGFAVPYSIPGGFRQETGFPMFLHNKYFIAFVILDVISFVLSTTSIILFLSVAIRSNSDMVFLLGSWVAGQTLLLFSILFLAMAFNLSLLVLYPQLIQASYLIYTVTYILLGAYTIVCFSLVDHILAIYTDASFFFERKYKLYPKINSMFPSFIH